MVVNADTFLSVLDGRLTREELLAYLLGTIFNFEQLQIEFTLAFPGVRDEFLDQ